jgi:hypothetical protein
MSIDWPTALRGKGGIPSVFHVGRPWPALPDRERKRHYTIMKIQPLLTSLVLALVVTSCATSTKPPDGDAPPKFAKRVKVLIYDSTLRTKTAHLDIYEEKAPERKYQPIALLTCDGNSREELVMTEAIFYRARQLGADAVIRGSQAGITPPLGFVFGGMNFQYRATAIVYTDK